MLRVAGRPGGSTARAFSWTSVDRTRLRKGLAGGSHCSSACRPSSCSSSLPPPPPPPPLSRPWHARGHSCLEAPIEGSDGASGEYLICCTTCGTVGHPGARWGRSALASDYPGARTSGRERQLAWISRGKHPSRRDGLVGSAAPLSDSNREFMATKLGLLEVLLSAQPLPSLRQVGPTLSEASPCLASPPAPRPRA